MSELKPCPFCRGESSVHSNRNWHSIKVNHKEDCILGNSEVTLAYANSTGQRELLVSDWNTRTSPEVDRDCKMLCASLTAPHTTDPMAFNQLVENAKLAADTIQSQKTEIENLKTGIKSWHRVCESYEDQVNELQARVKELEGVLRSTSTLIDMSIEDMGPLYKEHPLLLAIKDINQALVGTETPAPEGE